MQNPPLKGQKLFSKNQPLPQPLTFHLACPSSGFLGSRLRNSWDFRGLLVDPKGDPQEPLREAA